MNLKYNKIREEILTLPEQIDVTTLQDAEEFKGSIERLETNLGNLSFDEKCSMFHSFNSDINYLIDNRKQLVEPWKACVKDVEKKFLPIIRGLEALKAKCQEEISQEIFNNIEQFTNEEGKVSVKKGKVSIYEGEPEREFQVEDISQVPLEFLKIDEEAIAEYMNIFGEAPQGVQVKETRKCKIVCSKK